MKLFVLNIVVALLLAVNYYHVGCYKDKSARAIPKNLGVWRNDNKLIEKCAQAAKRAGYSAFAVQFKSECWSGPLAHMTYSIYGTSSGCLNGVGGTWAQDVYFFSKWCFVKVFRDVTSLRMRILRVILQVLFTVGCRTNNCQCILFWLILNENLCNGTRFLYHYALLLSFAGEEVWVTIQRTVGFEAVNSVLNKFCAFFGCTFFL